MTSRRGRRFNANKVNVGFRSRVGSRNRQMLEPSALASRLVNKNGSQLIPETPDKAVFVRALLGTFFAMAQGATTSTTGLTMNNILIYENQVSTGSASTTATRFTEARIKRIEVWGDDSAILGTPATSNAPLILTMASATFRGDGAVFRDFGTLGNDRAHITVIPNFEFRETWFAATDTTSILFNVRHSVATPTAASTPLVRLTLEMR